MQLIKYETALLVKKILLDEFQKQFKIEGVEYCCQSQLQKWLRDNKDIDIITKTMPECGEDNEIECYNIMYDYKILKRKCTLKFDIIHSDESFDTYEEALEDGIQQALELIKND